jgi:hypothetical protein
VIGFFIRLSAKARDKKSGRKELDKEKAEGTTGKKERSVG